MKHRDTGLDVTRILAFLFVVNVHAFVYNGFYDTVIHAPTDALLIFFRILFAGCVPLFLMLSGYLMCGKQVDLEEKGAFGQYLRKVSGVVLTYVLCALTISLVRRFYLRQGMTWRELFFSIFSFGQYSWYMNMYLGLYLMLPALNLIWAHAGGRRGHRIVVCCLLVLTALPSFLNGFDLTTPGVLLRPILYDARTPILPNWWERLYPVTYYFLGAYLRTHVQMKQLRTGKLLALLLLCLSAFTAFNLWQSWGRTFYLGAWLEDYGWQSAVAAVLVFLTVNSIHFPLPRPWAEKLLALLSELTLGAYLLSWIPDQLVYPMLFARVEDGAARMLLFPFTAAASAAAALAGAFGIRCVVKLLQKKKRFDDSKLHASEG